MQGQIERLEAKELLLERKLQTAAKDAQRPQIFATAGMNAFEESKVGTEGSKHREREQVLEERERAVREAERRCLDPPTLVTLAINLGAQSMRLLSIRVAAQIDST